MKGSFLIAELIRSSSWRHPVLLLPPWCMEWLPLRAGQGSSFVLRRLHSLTGIIPVGAFLFEHILISNSTAIGQTGLQPMPAKSVFWRIFRWCFSWSSSASGCRLPFTPSTVSISGIAETEIPFVSLDRKLDVHPRSAGQAASPSSTSCGTPTPCASRASISTNQPCSFVRQGQAEVLHNPLLFLFYVVGLIAASWHFAYGIWLFSAKWGIVSGEKAQRDCFVFAWPFSPAQRRRSG